MFEELAIFYVLFWRVFSILTQWLLDLWMKWWNGSDMLVKVFMFFFLLLLSCSIVSFLSAFKVVRLRETGLKVTPTVCSKKDGGTEFSHWFIHGGMEFLYEDGKSGPFGTKEAAIVTFPASPLHGHHSPTRFPSTFLHLFPHILTLTLISIFHASMRITSF